MAEAALYANYSEPQFPFEAAAPALQWVVPYVENLTANKRRQCYHGTIFRDSLHILLVLTRARTSALLAIEFLELYSKLIKKLNSTLRSLPVNTGAVHHEIQLVYRRRATVFVVCKKSPRFIWNRTLTHRDVGFNLDFCGAGHIYGKDIREMAGVGTFAFQDSGQYLLTHEGIYLDGVNDLTPIKEHFNKRTALFNETMNRLGMSYRFAHFWAPLNRKEVIQSILNSPEPPSTEQWKSIYPYLCLLPYGMSFTSAETRFKVHWSALANAIRRIQSTWPSPMECCETTDNLFRDLRRFFDSDETFYTDFIDFTSHKTEILQCLETIELFAPVQCTERYYWIKQSDVKRFCGSIIELLTMHVAKRNRLRHPLVHDMGLGEKWYSYGGEIWSTDPLRPGLKSLFSYHFWFDEVNSI